MAAGKNRGKHAVHALRGHVLHQLGGADGRIAQTRGRGDGSLGIGSVVQKLDSHVFPSLD